MANAKEILRNALIFSGAGGGLMRLNAAGELGRMKNLAESTLLRDGMWNKYNTPISHALPKDELISKLKDYNFNVGGYGNLSRVNDLASRGDTSGLAKLLSEGLESGSDDFLNSATTGGAGAGALAALGLSAAFKNNPARYRK